MKIKSIALVSVALLMVVHPAIAGFNVTGADLVKSIKADQRVREGTATVDDAFDGMMMRGYLGGALDAMDFMDQKYCSPAYVDMNEVGQIVAKYLAKNPVYLDRNASSLVRTALQQAFPCGGK